MNATMTTAPAMFDQRQAKRVKNLLMYSFIFILLALMIFEPAFATGTTTTTGTGGAAAAQTRISNVALGWQNIVMAVGVAILVIAWSVIGYAIAFNGKTMKDMQGPAIGTTVAGLAPVLVGWLFS